MRNDKRIELKLWLIVALIIGLAVLAGNVFGQIDITKRTVTLDSLRSRGGDTIWITNKTGGLAWLRVNQDDSLFFGDGTGEYSFGEQYETDTIKTTFIWINDSTYIDSDGSYYYTGETFYNGMYGTTNNGAEGAIYTYASDNGDTVVVNLYTLDADAQQMSILIDRSGIYYDEGTVPETFGENHFVTRAWVEGNMALDSIPIITGTPDTVIIDMQNAVEKVCFTNEFSDDATLLLANTNKMRTIDYNFRATGDVTLTFAGGLNWLSDDPDWDAVNNQYTFSGSSLSHFELSILKVTFSGVHYYKIKFSGEQI